MGQTHTEPKGSLDHNIFYSRNLHILTVQDITQLQTKNYCGVDPIPAQAQRARSHKSVSPIFQKLAGDQNRSRITVIPTATRVCQRGADLVAKFSTHAVLMAQMSDIVQCTLAGWLITASWWFLRVGETTPYSMCVRIKPFVKDRPSV